MKYLQDTDYLDVADWYASKASGCCKVAVGCVIVQDERIISFGANQSIMSNCKLYGCYRQRRFGDDSKIHRNPEDCSAVHSEIDALANLHESAKGATVYVTRYPCEGCAKALIAAGVSRVIYGGSAQISLITDKMFDNYDIRVFWVPDWKEDHSDR